MTRTPVGTVRTLIQWLKMNSVMLVNAGSLVGATAVTSVLGFVYWWVAARRFPPEAIGVASAAVSAMMLLGSFCVLGLGTLLITELPRQPGQEASLISTALVTVGGVGACVGVLFALVAPYTSAGFVPLSTDVIHTAIFATGVGFTAITLVLDQALIGLLRGGLQFWRNALFAVVKLIALFAIGVGASGTQGILMYGTWAFANVLSLVALFAHVVWKQEWVRSGSRSGSRSGFRSGYLPQWGLLRKLGLPALQHHMLNLTLQFPTLVLPVLVTIVLSAKMNAWFYVSWMIVSFVFIVPGALTTVLHAMNSAQPSTTLGRKARVTMSLAVVTGLLANLVLQSATKQVLSLFGSSYAEQAAWCLRILVLAAFPLIIKNHYISICRIQDRITTAMLAMIPGGLLELGMAALGAHLGGLAGLSAGWVAAIVVEALFMLRTVYNAVRSFEMTTRDSFGEEAIWLAETISMPAMPTLGQSYLGAEAIWLAETISMPALRRGAIEARVREGHAEQREHTRGRDDSEHYRLKPQLRRYKIEQIPDSLFK